MKQTPDIASTTPVDRLFHAWWGRATFGLSPAALMLTYMDFMVAFFFAFHMGIIFKIPMVGPKMLDLVSDGRFILSRYPKIRTRAFIGLVLFVIFPTSTTGSIGGSIFGRLLGLKRWTTLIAILIGSIIGNGLMFLFAEQINRVPWVRDSIWLKIIGAAGLVVVFILFERRYKALRKKFDKEMSAERDATSPPAQSDSTSRESELVE